MVDMESMLDVFRDFMVCAGDIFYWHYDGEMRLVSTNCPNAELIDNLFSFDDSKKTVFEACRESNLPALVMDSLSLAWLAVPYKVNGILINIFAIGPVFFSSISEENLYKEIQSHKFPNIRIHDIISQLITLPVIQHTQIMQYGVMLHYCVTKEKIVNSEIQVVKPAKKNSERHQELNINQNIHTSYIYEQQIFRAIETGNIQYKGPERTMQVGTLSVGDPLRQAKNEMIVFVSFSSRAAIRGGLPDETAYRLSDFYIQMVEGGQNLSDVYQHGITAYKDFLYRVHKYKLTNGRSLEIQNCISYIENHLTEKLNYDEMAKHLGYSRNYLSSKFNKEVGTTLNDYITEQKLELAKLWLRGKSDSISEISSTLNFNSTSYFGALFHKYTGVSPSDYRNNSNNKRASIGKP